MPEEHSDSSQQDDAVPASARWFTRSKDRPERGPFSRDALTRAVREGRLSRSTLVRRDDEAGYLPFADHPGLSGTSEARPKLDALTNPYAPPAEPPARARAVSSGEGTLVGGLFAGFFGSCIGWGIVEAIGKPATKRGARVGFACALAFVLLRLFITDLLRD